MVFKKVLVSLTLCMAVLPAFADRVFRDPTGQVILRDNVPCPAVVLAHIPEKEVHDRFSKADTIVDGKPFVACYAESGPAVFLVFEDGDQGVLPQDSFKPYNGV